MRWIIGRGDGYAFTILSDPAGPFTTRAEALAHLLAHLEADRRELHVALYRARRMLRRAKATAQHSSQDADPG